MAFRETEIGESLQLFVDLVDHLVGGAMQRAHAVVEPAAQPLHAFGRTLGPHGPPQLVGLGGRETGAVDRELHQLLLEKRYSQRLSQGRFHGRVVVDNRVQAVAPPNVGMHRPALDGPGTDQRDFHHQVVEHPWLEPGQSGHLRARLHLEHADGISARKHLVHRRLGEIQPGQVHVDALVLG